MLQVRRTALLHWMIFLLIATPTSAQGVKRPPATASLLRELSASVEELTARVSSERRADAGDRVRSRRRAHRGGETGLVIGRQRSIGSGAIIDADGYIITNAHVVAGARHVQVVLHRDTTADGPVRSLAADAGQTVDARIVGTANDIDLALLKVDVTGLRRDPAGQLRRHPAGRTRVRVRQSGRAAQLGHHGRRQLRRAAAGSRQPDHLYSDRRADQSRQQRRPARQCRRRAGRAEHVHSVGVRRKSRTGLCDSERDRRVGLSAAAEVRTPAPRPASASACRRSRPRSPPRLDLPRTSGVMVSDVMPDSPAEAAGLGVKDVITTVNGKPVESVPMLSLELSRRRRATRSRWACCEGPTTVSANVTVMERPHPIDELAALADPEKSAIPQLGIIGIDINDATRRAVAWLRISSGVFVAARTQVSSGNDVPLVAGDVIHAVNSFAVRSVDGLRVLVDDVKAGSALVLQIERNGQLLFVTCQIY